ncbi:ABZJ_00895 family protein [Vibrio sp. WXL210]|uniref:ABZJ_00895 family protein n=1 Tax=Vibrio sp. WXL210 TaxID=3450709 RepID=UPI003EC4B7A9
MESEIKHPSVIFVTLLLCFASICWATLLFAIEYILGTELQSTGFLSTLIPALSVGYYVGYKSGDMMPSKTRWYAVTLWFIASLIVFSLILIAMDISPIELVTEFGWITLVMAIVLLVTICIAYLVLKSGEKMAIKMLLKAKQG